jgi:hypothetical protein
MKEELAQLQERIAALEAENSQLKVTLALQEYKALGVINSRNEDKWKVLANINLAATLDLLESFKPMPAIQATQPTFPLNQPAQAGTGTRRSAVARIAGTQEVNS